MPFRGAWRSTSPWTGGEPVGENASMFSVLNLQSLLGLVVIVAACWGLSENRRAFPWKLTLGAVAVQAALVLALFAIPGSQKVLAAITGAVDGLNAATQRGTQFVFGYLAGGDQPYAVANEGALFTFAFQCHSSADRAEITRISGSTWKAKVNSAPSLPTT